MNKFHYALAAVVAGVCLTTAAPKVQAQVSIDIGAEPGCPYGYYDYEPYACAPYGYYGPEWFIGGAFIGAGPWVYGPAGFHCHIDSRFDLRPGYTGPIPKRRDLPDSSRSLHHIDKFTGMGKYHG